MSKIEVDTIDTVTGTTTLQVGSTNVSTINLGASGDTINIPSGATFNVNGTVGTMSGQNYPAFQAYLSSNQSVTSNTTTKVQIDTEVFDTDGYFDNSTNYRFTPLVAGKYFVHGSVFGDPGNTSDLSYVIVYLYKNGSENMNQKFDFRSNEGRDANLNFSTIIDMNGSTDYIELYGLVKALDNSGTLFGGTNKRTYFGAYRIGD